MFSRFGCRQNLIELYITKICLCITYHFRFEPWYGCGCCCYVKRARVCTQVDVLYTVEQLPLSNFIWVSLGIYCSSQCLILKRKTIPSSTCLIIWLTTGHCHALQNKQTKPKFFKITWLSHSFKHTEEFTCRRKFFSANSL